MEWFKFSFLFTTWFLRYIVQIKISHSKLYRIFNLTQKKGMDKAIDKHHIGLYEKKKDISFLFKWRIYFQQYFFLGYL